MAARKTTTSKGKAHTFGGDWTSTKLDVLANYLKAYTTALKNQVLTKRADRLVSIDRGLEWPENVWIGVSVEDAEYFDRIDDLRKTRARVKFLSLEPLLGPMRDLDLRNIDWVIVGGESGPGARPMDKTWITEIRDQCREASVAFFFKQWGGANRKRAGRLLEGRTRDEMPRVSAVAQQVRG